ncbi:MAG: L-threonylcarbamoyladenylate synthase [Hyphomicrobiales bacterium]
MTIYCATTDEIARAGRKIREGGLVAFPTETVYGLGANALDGMAVASLYEAKGRPRFNPLIVHVPDAGAARQLGIMTPLAARLTDALWPGPLTLVLDKTPDCPVAELATAGLDSVALRVPSHPLARALLKAAECPVAAPSANRSGHVSPTAARHVEDDFAGAIDILDGGACPLGMESTIVDARGEAPVLLRAGAVTREEIVKASGMDVGVSGGSAARPSAPGQLESHYAPRARLRLNATAAITGEALLAFGPAPEHDGPSINLSPAGDLREAAARLFSALRELDGSGAGTIAVMPIPCSGLGEAINDRLARAAAPRPGGR